jgi:hypothetical protein
VNTTRYFPDWVSNDSSRMCRCPHARDRRHVDPKAWTLDWDLPPRPEDVNRFDLRREAEEIAKTAAEEADPGLVVRVVTSLRRDGEHDAVLSGLGL